jgi:hypothetical protein
VSSPICVGASLSGREPMVRTMVGAAMLGILTSSFTFLNIDAHYQEIIKGGVIVAPVVADKYRQSGAARHEKLVQLVSNSGTLSLPQLCWGRASGFDPWVEAEGRLFPASRRRTRPAFEMCASGSISERDTRDVTPLPRAIRTPSPAHESLRVRSRPTRRTRRADCARRLRRRRSRGRAGRRSFRGARRG